MRLTIKAHISLLLLVCLCQCLLISPATAAKGARKGRPPKKNTTSIPSDDSSSPAPRRRRAKATQTTLTVPETTLTTTAPTTTTTSEPPSTTEWTIATKPTTTTVRLPNATDMSLVLFKGLLVNHGVVPEVLLNSPRHELKVGYSREIYVNLGEEIRAKDVVNPPKVVKWPREADTYYSLIMTDLDAPHQLFPSMKQWVHWAVLNIEKGQITPNNTVVEYVPPAPRNNSGNHRIVFTLYKQRAEMNFHEMFPEHLPKDPKDPRRENFHTKNFAMKYFLEPLALNFFRIEFHDDD